MPEPRRAEIEEPRESRPELHDAYDAWLQTAATTDTTQLLLRVGLFLVIFTAVALGVVALFRLAG